MNSQRNGMNNSDVQMKFMSKKFYSNKKSPSSKSALYLRQKNYSDYQATSPDQIDGKKIIHQSIKRNYDPEGNEIVIRRIVREAGNSGSGNKKNIYSNSIMNIKPKSINSTFEINNGHENEILSYSNYSDNEEMNNTKVMYKKNNYGYEAISPKVYQYQENNYKYSAKGTDSDGGREIYPRYLSPNMRNMINSREREINTTIPNYTSGSDYDEPNLHSVKHNKSTYNYYSSKSNYNQRLGLNRNNYNRYKLESPYLQSNDYDSPDRSYDYNASHFQNINIDRIKSIQPIYQEKLNRMNNQYENIGDYENNIQMDTQKWKKNQKYPEYYDGYLDEPNNNDDIANRKATQIQSRVRGFLGRKKVLRYFGLEVYVQSFCDKIQDILCWHVREEVFNIFKRILNYINIYGKNGNRKKPRDYYNITDYSRNYKTSRYKKNDYSSTPTQKVKHCFLDSPSYSEIQQPHNRFYTEINGNSTNTYRQNLSKYSSYKNINDSRKFGLYKYKYENNTSNRFQDKPDYTSGIGARSYSLGVVKSSYASSPQNIHKCHCLDGIRKKNIDIYSERNIETINQKNIYETKRINDVLTETTMRGENLEEEKNYTYNGNDFQSDNYISINIVKLPEKRENSINQNEETYIRNEENKEYIQNDNEKRKRFSNIQMKKAENVRIYPLLEKKVPEVKKEDIRQVSEAISTRDIYTNTLKDPNVVAKNEIINIAGKKKEQPKIDREKEQREKEIEIERRVKERIEIERREFEKIDNIRKEQERRDREREEKEKEKEKRDNEKREKEEQLLKLLIEKEKKIKEQQELIERDRKDIELREREAQKRRELEVKERKDWENKERLEREKRIKEDEERKERDRKDRERREQLDRERREKEKKEMEQILIIERERIIREETERLGKEMKEKERKEREERMRREREEKQRRDKEDEERRARERKLEEEKRERERLERERRDKLDRERRDKEKKDLEEQLRIEREKRIKEEKDRIEREKKEKEERFRRERERQEQLRKEERERIEREKRDRLEREMRERERKEEQLKFERKLKEERLRIEKERKDKERQSLEEKKRREREEREKSQKTQFGKTTIIENDKLIRLENYEKERQERLEKRKRDQDKAQGYQNVTTTYTTTKFTTTQYNQNKGLGKSGSNTNITVSYYKPTNMQTVKVKDEGKYTGVNSSLYTSKKYFQKNTEDTKSKFEKEYETKIDMGKKELNTGIQIGVENNQYDLQKKYEKNNGNNKYIKTYKETNYNYNTDEINSKYYGIKSDREKNILRAMEIIKIFILSRTEIKVIKRQYFIIWRRKARLLGLEENAKIIQEFCRINLKMSRINKPIKNWKYLGKKIFYKTRVKLLKMAPKLSKEEIRLNKIIRLIKITKVKELISKKRYFLFLILAWRLYAKNINLKNVNMKFLYEELLNTYISYDYDIFGNYQYENSNVKNAINEAMTTHKFIVFHPEDNQNKKMKPFANKRASYYQKTKIVVDNTEDKYSIGKYNVKDENNVENDDEEKKEEKKSRFGYFSKYKKNKFYNNLYKNDTDKKESYSYNVSYSKYDKNYDSNGDKTKGYKITETTTTTEVVNNGKNYKYKFGNKDNSSYTSDKYDSNNNKTKDYKYTETKTTEILNTGNNLYNYKFGNKDNSSYTSDKYDSNNNNKNKGYKYTETKTTEVVNSGNKIYNYKFGNKDNSSYSSDKYNNNSKAKDYKITETKTTEVVNTGKNYSYKFGNKDNSSYTSDKYDSNNDNKTKGYQITETTTTKVVSTGNNLYNYKFGNKDNSSYINDKYGSNNNNKTKGYKITETTTTTEVVNNGKKYKYKFGNKDNSSYTSDKYDSNNNKTKDYKYTETKTTEILNTGNNLYNYKFGNKDYSSYSRDKNTKKLDDNKYSSYKKYNITKYTKTDGNTENENENKKEKATIESQLSSYTNLSLARNKSDYNNNYNKSSYTMNKSYTSKNIFSKNTDMAKPISNNNNYGSNISVIYSSNIKKENKPGLKVEKNLDIYNKYGNYFDSITSQKDDKNKLSTYGSTYQKSVYVKTSNEEPKTYSSKIEIKTITPGSGKDSNYYTKSDTNSLINNYTSYKNTSSNNDIINKLNTGNGTNIISKYTSYNFGDKSGSSINNYSKYSTSNNNYGTKVDSKYEKKFEAKPYKSSAGKSVESKKVTVTTKTYTSSRITKH